MAEVNNQSPEDPQPQQHSPLPTKRKPDVECLDPIEDPKKQKTLNQVTEEAKEEKEPEEGEEEEDDDDEEEEDDEEEDEEEEVVVDRKGKGIMKEDPKGKGKMVAEDDDDDDDSDSDLSERVNNGSDDGASDLSDDPLAEVDLDNILPSRTRRRVPPPPGAYEVNDDDDDDDDDSDVDA